MADRPVRVRMAPSPTGPVHVGSARTALFNWLFARGRSGVFVLRIDDTDLERSTREDEELIYDGFRWLGLDWDEGPVRQSDRLDTYREYAAKLIAAGDAYRCYCTREELEAERQQAAAEHRPYVYSRRCLHDPPAGRGDFTVRFKVPEGDIEINDLVRGPVRWENLPATVGDFVIMKSNAWPTYIFSSPIDDAELEITHVIRAEEHLSNTPKQILVLRALGYGEPDWAHVPLLLATDRSKLSKRRHPVLLTEYREQGYLPEAMVNYLALLGWNPGTEEELFSREQLVELFHLGQVQRAGAIFDVEKLTWMNGVYIRALTPDALAERLKPFLPGLDFETIRRAAPALQERMRTLADAGELLAYINRPPQPPQLPDEERERLRAALGALQPIEWEPERIESALESLREAKGWSRNQLFKPIRLAVVGGNSPPIGYTLALLPKPEALSRMEKAA